MPEQLNTTLPQGPEYDSYKFQLLVKIIDDLGGMSEYLIPTPVTVAPIQNVNFMSEILFDDATSNFNRKLYEGDLIDSSQVIAYLSGKLNSECYFDRNTLSYSGIYLVNFVAVFNIIDCFYSWKWSPQLCNNIWVRS